MHRETLTVNCNVTVDVRDAATGELLERHDEHNLVTLAGCNLIRDLLNETTDSGITHLAVGGQDTAVAASDTQLAGEILRGALTKRSTNDGQLTLQYFLSSTSANGSSIKEAGLFNSGTAGTLFARVVHDTIAKTSSVTITYTWVISIAAS